MKANQRYRGNRVEEPVKGHPGIYRVWHWDKKKERYVDPRLIRGCKAKHFRAVKCVKVLGKQTKEQAKFDSLEDAREWKGKTDQSTVKPKIVRYTFGELVDDWQSWSVNYFAPSTLEQYAKEVRHLEVLRKVPVEELQAEDIDRWLQHVIHPDYPKPRSRRSFEREVATLTTILNWYRERKNPRYQHPVLKRHKYDAVFSQKPRVKKVPLTEEQLEAVLERLRTHSKCQVYYYLASFQALSGPRIGEACGLKWSDIDFYNQRYTIHRIVWWEYESRNPRLRDGTKTGETRVVKLCPRLIQLLTRWKEIGSKGPFVFHNDGQLLRYSAIQNGYNKAFRGLSLPHRSTHVFRHTFATLHADQTKDIRATQGALGHRDLRTTQHYANVSELTQERALGDFHLGQVKGDTNPVPPKFPQALGHVIPFKNKLG